MNQAPRKRDYRWVRLPLGIIVLGLTVFWVWALFFPPTKQSVAKVSDEAWAERAESVCRAASEERDQLADLRRVSEAGPSALEQRAEIIDTATAIVETMVDEVMSSPLVTPEDQAIADTWAGLYRNLIADRRLYTDELRGGENGAFAESAVDGSPISDYINDFTVANRMKSCSAPLDLAV